MKMFKLAVENQRWDLVAHTIVFTTARFLNGGGKPDAGKSRQKSKRTGKEREFSHLEKEFNKQFQDYVDKIIEVLNKHHINFNIVDDAGDTLASQALQATSNEVRVFAGEYSLEDIPLETTETGTPINRIRAYEHAGHVMELRVEVDGPINMSGYECRWDKLLGSGLYPEVDSAVTAFVGNTSTNYLRIPADTMLGSAYWLEVSIRPSGGYTDVFEGVVPGIQVRYAKVNGTSFFVGFAEGEQPHLLNELHLFTSRTYYRAEIEIFPAGYFTDEPNNDVTKDVYRRSDYIDTVGYFHKYTDLMYLPGILWDSTKISQNDYFHFIKPVNTGTTALYTVSWAYSTKVYIEGDPGYVRSANSLQAYTDPMALNVPQYGWEVPARSTQALRVDVETEGGLGDYECVWSTTPDAGGLGANVTDFVQGVDTNWYSENQWIVPSGIDGQQLTVDVAIRYKGTQTELGKDNTQATIMPGFPGDVNGNGSVDLADLGAVAGAFHAEQGAPNWDPIADLNGDGVVDIYDLVQVGMNFGNSQGP